MLTPALAQEGTEQEASCAFGAALGADFTGYPRGCKDKVCKKLWTGQIHNNLYKVIFWL